MVFFVIGIVFNLAQIPVVWLLIFSGKKSVTDSCLDIVELVLLTSLDERNFFVVDQPKAKFNSTPYLPLLLTTGE